MRKGTTHCSTLRSNVAVRRFMHFLQSYCERFGHIKILKHLNFFLVSSLLAICNLNAGAIQMPVWVHDILGCITDDFDVMCG